MAKKRQHLEKLENSRECGNCHIPMHKTVDPIIFGYPRHPRTRWKCPKCGADLPRMEEPGELDEKPTIYTSSSKSFDDEFWG